MCATNNIASPAQREMRRKKFLEDVFTELRRAYDKHGEDQWGRHEFYAILLEEVDEVWDEIKRNGETYKVYNEIVQVVAMCLRFVETGNRYSRYDTL